MKTISSKLKHISAAICITCLLIAYFSCKNNNNFSDIKFTLFNPACHIDTLILDKNIHYYKTDAFLISNFENNPKNEYKIDSFSCSVKDPLFSIYGEYHIIFYKKSKITNNEHIINNPKDLDRYSQENDLLYIYVWSKGKFVSKSLYNGKLFSRELKCIE